VASLSQGRTAAAQCGLFTYKSVPVIFEPPCILITKEINWIRIQTCRVQENPSYWHEGSFRCRNPTINNLGRWTPNTIYLPLYYNTEVDSTTKNEDTPVKWKF